MRRRHQSSAGLMYIISIATIVAIVVLPQMFSGYIQEENLSRAQKGYASLANALTMVKAWGGDYVFEAKRDNLDDLKDWYEEYLEPNIQTVKTCYDEAGCWNEGNTIGLNGINVNYNRKGVGVGKNIVTTELRDGTFVNIDLCSADYIWKYFFVDLRTESGLTLYYDINGKKKPNVVGKDIFVAIFTEDGLVPAYRDQTANKVLSDCSPKGTGTSCLRIFMKK